jgi:hypothetical protein
MLKIIALEKFPGFDLLMTYLSSDEVIQKVDRGRVEEQVVRYGVVEKAGVSVSQTAGGNEQRNRHWDGQVYGEGVTEALDHDFAREFACEVQKRTVKLRPLITVKIVQQ